MTPDCTKVQSFVQRTEWLPLEKKIILALEEYPMILSDAADEFNPASICNYTFGLAQMFNTFYDAHSISKAESEEKKTLRLIIVIMTASVLRHAMKLMGIRLPDKM
jgi:arginyl-tRNA synthetase